MKKRTTEEFKEIIFNLFGDEFLVIGEYVNNDTKIKMLHKKCEQYFDITPHYFLKKHACPICSKSNTHMTRTTETFKKKVFELTGNEYEVIGEYIGANSKLKMKHSVCGYEYETRPNNFLQGSRCPKCGGTLRKNTEDFKKEIFDLAGDEYSIMSEYEQNNKKIKFIHNVCGNTFEMTPSNFLKGYGCSKCSGKFKKNTELFKQQVFDLTGDEYEILGEYINNHTKIKLKHNCGYEFYMRPNNFLSNGNRCPKCQMSHSKGEKEIEKTLNSMNIIYEKFKKYEGLTGVGGGLLSYDFYLPKYNTLIEYQGEQHDKPIKFFGSESRFKTQKEHDFRKEKFAKEHNIKLIEIWYWDFNNIEEILKNCLLTY